MLHVSPHTSHTATHESHVLKELTAAHLTAAHGLLPLPRIARASLLTAAASSHVCSRFTRPLTMCAHSLTAHGSLDCSLLTAHCSMLTAHCHRLTSYCGRLTTHASLHRSRSTHTLLQLTPERAHLTAHVSLGHSQSARTPSQLTTARLTAAASPDALVAVRLMSILLPLPRIARAAFSRFVAHCCCLTACVLTFRSATDDVRTLSHGSLLTARCSLLTARCSLLTAHCSPLTTQRSLPPPHLVCVRRSTHAPLMKCAHSLTSDRSVCTSHCARLTRPLTKRTYSITV